jgi:hypothetical protein
VLGPLEAGVRIAPDGAVLLALDVQMPEALPEVVVWGVPLGVGGALSDEAVREVLARPDHARSLVGRFVVVGRHGGGLRAVTSADAAVVLRRSRGPLGEAAATRGVPALLGAGRRPHVAMDHVAEHVMFDHVLGDDELVADVEAVPEAAILDTRADGLAPSSYWPVAERFAPGPETTPLRLRANVATALEPVVHDGRASLALTGGRDSVLVASVLGERGAQLPTVTMGGADSPDARGAAAVASALGWDHALAPVDATIPPSLARAVAAARWDEGLQSGSDTAGPQLRWPAAMRGRLWLTGSGGEAGRAFLWAEKAIDDDPLDILVRGRAEHLDADRAARFAERVAEGLRVTCAGAPREGLEVLDVLYVRGRMRKWLAGIATPPGTEGAVAAFTHPSVVSALLDIPLARRRDASLVDEALAMGGRDLGALARAAADAGTSATGRRRPSLRARVSARLHDRVTAGRRLPLHPALRSVLDELGDDLRTRDVLGERWWDLTLARAPSSGAHSRWLWNVIAVEALSRALDEAPSMWGASPRG